MRRRKCPYCKELKQLPWLGIYGKKIGRCKECNEKHLKKSRNRAIYAPHIQVHGPLKLIMIHGVEEDLLECGHYVKIWDSGKILKMRRCKECVG